MTARGERARPRPDGCRRHVSVRFGLREFLEIDGDRAAALVRTTSFDSPITIG
jgi:hypothetical protein